jgi:mannose-6-phosphate isomerase-like protein (cupin superfamily)
MPATIISIKTAEHYKWGGPNKDAADGWYLVKSPDLHIIEEGMPSGTSETLHHHVHARQFFLVLEGELTMEVEYQTFVLQIGEGIEISPGQLHRAFNRSRRPLRILVTSQPPSHGDRVEDRI